MKRWNFVREIEFVTRTRSVLECASPLALLAAKRGTVHSLQIDCRPLVAKAVEGYSTPKRLASWRILYQLFVLLLNQSIFAAALDWQAGPGYRSAALDVPANGKTGFVLLPSTSTGVTFTNHLSDRSVAHNRILENGSGVALGDIDGDGLCDIYFCQLEGPNVLYHNLGNWQFEDITESAGVACPNQFSTGAVFADIDGDGDLDLLVNSIGGGTRAFLNDSHGHFTEVTATRLVRRFGSTSMALADIDGNGSLDLYVANYRTDTYHDRPSGLKVEARMVDGKVVITPPDRFIPIVPRSGGIEVIEMGERDFLYLNDSAGHFAPVSWTMGSFLDEDGKALKEPPKDWGLSVMFRDINGDGVPDIYVCNDFIYSRDKLWLSEGSRGYRAVSNQAMRNMSLSSMAIDVADINRDGLDDIIVVDMLSRSHANRQRQRPNMMKGIVSQPIEDANYRPEVPRNTLFLNRGDGTYAEIAQLSGVAATEWSWGVIFLDVDLDGYEDILVATGNGHDVQDADALREIGRVRENESPEARLKRFPPLETAMIALRNRGDLTFEDKGSDWGFDRKAVSNGMALADLDNDGDLDVVVNNLNGSASLYRNQTSAARVAVRLKGKAPNTRGIGAKIRVQGGPVSQSQEMICGGRYLSCDDNIRVFAAGTSTNQLRIEVTWRSGAVSVVEKAGANRIYEIDETEAGSLAGSTLATTNSPSITPLFRDVSDLLHHTNIDEPFDDFLRQSLLGRRFSQLGPGVAWVDIDHDGWEDLVIGSGRAGAMSLWKNDGKGGFLPWPGGPFENASRDQTSIVSWSRPSGDTVLIAGSANYEDGATNAAPARVYIPGQEKSQEILSPEAGSTGPLALGDLDGSGNLALFVGGRISAGRYPEPVSSRLYRNAGGPFRIDKTNHAVFEKLGLVSGAVFSDLDGDGLPELILACEWGPVRIFKNEKGVFHERTRELGLDKFTGWWNGVTAGDFDGDGRMDIVASNWGRNTKYQQSLRDDARIFYGDYDKDGTLEVLEASYDRGVDKVVPWRDYETVSKAMPFVADKITSYRAFGNASISEILGTYLNVTTELRARTLDSMVFLNRGDHFEARPLPGEAQFAPAFGITVADFDGDGLEDIFLAQNFFDVESETSRYDGGRGLLLRGDGKGGFVPVPGQESGIKIYGEQRGCSAADYDGDGRTDLVVAQNRGATKLYRNQTAKPGLRIKLKGQPGNPNGIGAIIRLQHGVHMGPAREVHGGSGYWSEDSSVQVLGFHEKVTGVWVRWPGGRETVFPLSDSTLKEVTISERN